MFGTFPVENPTFESEVSLLNQLAPSLGVEIISKLVNSFNDLREAFDDGLIQYPYSLRELINIVRHMEKFPTESIDSVLRNVFDFDAHKTELNELVVKTFIKNGVNVKNIGIEAIQTLETENLEIKYRHEQPPAIDMPKHGKIDEKNEPHVGGNTWAGGTGTFLLLLVRRIEYSWSRRTRRSV